MTDFTTKDLWAPEVLVAEETDWGGRGEMGVSFGEGFSHEFGESGHERYVHTRLRYRAADGQTIRVVESWAPAELVSVGNLIDRPDEELLDWLRQDGRGGADAHHAYESARLERANPRVAQLLEVDVGEHHFLLWRLYCTNDDEPLLGQEELLRKNHEIGYARSMRLERILCSEGVWW
jgi:hypothetical protein